MYVVWHKYGCMWNIRNAIVSYTFYLQNSAGQLPPCLYIQMDNTCRDNKNKYMLIYFALMVEMELFLKVCSHLIVYLMQNLKLD